MDIGIIGAGNVGKALAVASARAGHSVTISSETFEEARAAADQTGATPVPSNRQTVLAADLVILAVPYASVGAVLGEIEGDLIGKILIDVTNRVSPEDPGFAVDGTSNAEEIQRRVPGTPVVKALNTAFAARQADPVVDGIPLDGFAQRAERMAVAERVEAPGSHRRCGLSDRSGRARASG